MTLSEINKCLDNKYGVSYTKLEELHDFYFEKYCDLKEENQDFKKQLENCYCNRIDCSGRIKDSKKYDGLIQRVENQQKEFIQYLEKEILELKKVQVISLEESIGKDFLIKVYKEVLSKFKEIIGNKDER